MRYLVTRNQQLFSMDVFHPDFELFPFDIISPIECLEYLQTSKVWGLDTETKGFDPYTDAVICMQIGNVEHQFIIDDTVDFNLFKPFLEDSTNLFILHNAKFDLRFFYHKRIIIKRVFDTFLAEKLLYLGYPSGQRGMSLKDCCENYLHIALDKTVRGMIHAEGLSPRVIKYAGEDVEYSIPLYDAQLRELTEKDLLTAIDIENAFVRVLAYIEYSGIKLDVSKWKEKMARDLLAMQESQKSLDDWVINLANPKFLDLDLQGDLFLGYKPVKCGVTWSSPKQVVALFETLGFDLWVKDKKTGELKKSVEANVIEPQKHKSTIAPIYLKYKQAEKVVTTYGQTFIDQINPVSGRIHTQFNQLMETTRLSSGGKNPENKLEQYINFQNIPGDSFTRSCFISERNNSLIDGDYTAQEDLVFTELSQESKLIEFYNSPEKRDGHSFVAKMCFPAELADIPEKDVKKLRPDLRQNAKGCKFCYHYGGAPPTAAKNLNISLEIAQTVYTNYFKAFPGIDNYFKKVKREAWDRGYILISKITGHKAFIYGWEELKQLEASFTSTFWQVYRAEKAVDSEYFKKEIGPKVKDYFKRKGNIERNALNTPVQGTSAQITKIAGIKFFDYLEKNNLLFTVLIPNAVHDELLIEAPDTIKDKVANALQICMEAAGKIFCKSVTLKAEPEIAKHWVH